MQPSRLTTHRPTFQHSRLAPDVLRYHVQEVMDLEWFFNVIIGAGVQGFVAGFRVCGDHDDGRVFCGGLGAQVSADIQSVDVRHLLVEDEEIHPVAECFTW